MKSKIAILGLTTVLSLYTLSARAHDVAECNPSQVHIQVQGRHVCIDRSVFDQSAYSQRSLQYDQFIRNNQAYLRQQYWRPRPQFSAFGLSGDDAYPTDDLRSFADNFSQYRFDRSGLDKRDKRYYKAAMASNLLSFLSGLAKISAENRADQEVSATTSKSKESEEVSSVPKMYQKNKEEEEIKTNPSKPTNLTSVQSPIKVSTNTQPQNSKASISTTSLFE